MLSYPFPPASLAGVYRTLRFVKYLPECGWKPIVIAPDRAVYDPQWSDPALETSIPSGTIVERTKVYHPIDAIEKAANYLRFRREIDTSEAGQGRAGEKPTEGESENNGRLKKFARNTLGLFFATPDEQIGWLPTAVKAALKLIRRHRIQAVYSTGPPHSSHLIAASIKMLTRLPMVIDFRDPWSRGTWRQHQHGLLHARLQPALEKFCVKHAARVILNTPALCDEFRAAYPKQPPEKFVAIPNGFDPDSCPSLQACEENTRRDESDVAVVCHPGTVYGKRDIRPVVAAVQELVHSGQRVKFDQIGSIENESDVKSYTESLGVEQDVRFHGMLPHGDTLRLMSSADIFLLCQPGTTLQIPGKIFEMLPFGRPIVALTESTGATAEVINRFGLGVVVPPSDSAAIARAISRNLSILKDYRVNGGWRKAMQAFNGRELTKLLGNVFDDCIRKR
jgi:glycosyltransferase involved in cell wall biosynthesis